MRGEGVGVRPQQQTEPVVSRKGRDPTGGNDKGGRWISRGRLYRAFCSVALSGHGGPTFAAGGELVLVNHPGGTGCGTLSPRLVRREQRAFGGTSADVCCSPGTYEIGRQLRTGMS